MIKKIKETLGQIFHSPEATGSWSGDDITVNMDGGVGGSWKVECAVDEEVVDCEDFKEPYTGVPAPDYLEIDPWFSPPVLSEKQMTYKEAHDKAVEERQILDESETNESADIHQKLYEMASKNWTTVVESQGGSENFHEGPGGWTSGTGYGQFTKQKYSNFVLDGKPTLCYTKQVNKCNESHAFVTEHPANQDLQGV